MTELAALKVLHSVEGLPPLFVMEAARLIIGDGNNADIVKLVNEYSQTCREARDRLVNGIEEIKRSLLEKNGSR